MEYKWLLRNLIESPSSEVSMMFNFKVPETILDGKLIRSNAVGQIKSIKIAEKT
jgi:hypothetical protein